MKCMYFIQLTTSTDFVTISVRLFLQVNFNNSNPFSANMNANMSYGCKYLHHHFELPSREPKAIFGSVI